VSPVDRWLLGGVAVVAVAALASGLGRTDLWPPDEPRVAEIAREMAASGSWLVPTLNGHPFLEEPPLFYWWQAGAYRLAGAPSAAAARLPAATAGIAGALVTAILASRLGADPLLAVVVLATAPEYWWMAHSATPDTAAAAATALALLLFYAAWQSGRPGALAVAAAALGVAYGCKSFLPVGLAVLTMAAFVAGTGRGRLRLGSVALTLVGIAVLTGAWVWFLVERLGWGAASDFLFANHLGRLVGLRASGHVRTVLYYVINLALDLFPWSLVLPAAVVAAWRGRAAPERRFPLIWAGAMLTVLTVSASKRAHYLLAAYPAFAVLVAQWWPEAWSGGRSQVARRLMLLTLIAVGPVLTLVLLGVRAEQVAAGWGATLRDVRPPESAWLAVAVAVLLGLALLRADRGRHVARTATVLTAYLTGIHLLLVLVVLPRLNPLATARAQAERLGRLADRGVEVVLFGSEGLEPPSPVLFYARRQLREIEDVGTLSARLRTGPACAVMRADDYAALAPVLPALPVRDGVLPGSRFVIVESTPGLCTTDPEPTRARGS